MHSMQHAQHHTTHCDRNAGRHSRIAAYRSTRRPRQDLDVCRLSADAGAVTIACRPIPSSLCLRDNTSVRGRQRDQWGSHHARRRHGTAQLGAGASCLAKEVWLAGCSVYKVPQSMQSQTSRQETAPAVKNLLREVKHDNPYRSERRPILKCLRT
jgi:hypothetical protein